jgi:hypothetical protein
MQFLVILKWLLLDGPVVERLVETHVGGTSDLEIHGAETRGTGINT